MNTTVRRTLLTACGDTMDATEILEILGMVNDMENISKVEIKLGHLKTLLIEKTTASKKGKEPDQLIHPAPTPDHTITESDFSGFAKATVVPPASNGNLATDAQRKYSDDLRNFFLEAGMSDNDIIYGIATALGEVGDDILHPSQWRDKMGRQQADTYIDVLEIQRKKLMGQKRGGFQ
jgi:hypothetical protein